MISYSFQQEGETGLLRLITHFGQEKNVSVYKQLEEQFRISCTAINKINYKKVVIESVWDTFLRVLDQENNYIPIKYIGSSYKEGQLIYIYEYYDSSYNSKWVASQDIIENAEILFVNVEILKAGQILRQTKINTYTGEYT